MTPVPSTPDPDPGRPARRATGSRRTPAVPALSLGSLGDVRPGVLLVAMPGLTDPTFSGAVVYVLDHGPTGTLGVVLGRPGEVGLREVLPGWCDLAVEPAVFHRGGPCETDTALCLAVASGPVTASDDAAGLRRVADAVCLVDLDADPGVFAGRLAGLRVFAGYAGWSAGQLAGELEEGAWACVPGSAEDVLGVLWGRALWREVLSRQRGELGVLSTAPEDPSQN